MYRFARFFTPFTLFTPFFCFFPPCALFLCEWAPLHRSLELEAGCCPSPCSVGDRAASVDGCFVQGNQCVWLSPRVHFRLFLATDTSVHIRYPHPSAWAMLPHLGLLIIAWQDAGCMGECRQSVTSFSMCLDGNNKFCPVQKVVRGHPVKESCDIPPASIFVFWSSSCQKLLWKHKKLLRGTNTYQSMVRGIYFDVIVVNWSSESPL